MIQPEHFIHRLSNYSCILQHIVRINITFSRFDPRLNSKDAERKFMWKSVTPYISFFIVLLIIVGVFPLCDKQWIPCSELSLVALFFTGKCLMS